MASANNNKRPTPAKSPALKSVKARATSDDLDDDDLDDDAPKGKKENSDARLRKLPFAKRINVKLSNLTARLERLSDKVEGWQDGDGAPMEAMRRRMAQVLVDLEQLTNEFGAVPASYIPRAPRVKGTSSVKADLVAGSLIRITDKRAPEYDGILEPAQLRGIKVIEVRGNKVIALTSDGIKAMFARGHVCLDA